MFANLPELLDFQRRFLFSLEAILAFPQNEQNIGSIFVQYEEGFQVYNAMCASYSNAINVAVENADRLAGIGNIDAAKGLQGYLIKPVQRICRYPLILKVSTQFNVRKSSSIRQKHFLTIRIY
jgi:cell division control protein 24